MMKRSILCLNSGSSSIKYSIFEATEEGLKRKESGVIEQIGKPGGRDFNDGLEEVISDLGGNLREGIYGAGHRIVHGGACLTSSSLIDNFVLEQLRQTIPLAPSHQQAAIAGIEALREINPDLPQVACFDTAFYIGLPELAQRFPLPEKYFDAGIRRFGFHGLSYEYVSRQVEPHLPEKTIIAHLGNGSSMVALLDGRPVETTMGFTPNSGTMMGTRCGDIEPGVLLYLMQEEGLTPDQTEYLLTKESGLLGVSGIASDMRELIENIEEDPRASRAVEMYCYSVLKHLGALVAVLGGLDLLIFTGGIGENVSMVREKVIYRLNKYLNFEMKVIKTDEEQIIAEQTLAIVSQKQSR